MICVECLLQGNQEECALQRKEMETVAKQHNWKLQKMYRESADMAAANRADRVAIQELLADAVLKRFDILMFMKTEHLGSNDDKVAAFLLQLDRNGIGLYHMADSQLSLATGTSLAAFMEASRA